MNIVDSKDLDIAKPILQELWKKIADAKLFGITMKGNRVTLRWNNEDDILVDVHMIVESVTLPHETKERREQHQRMEQLFKKYPKLQEELYFAEHGEHSQ